MRGLAVALAWIAASAAAQRPPSDVFDRVVAVVGTQVITQSDVDLMADVQLVRLGRYDKLSLGRTPEIRSKALEYLVVQAMIYEEARRLAFQRIRKDQVDQELAAFRAKFPDAAAYRRFLANHERTEAQIGELFRRILLSNRFAADTVRLNVRVEETDVDAYLARHGDSEMFRGKTPEGARTLARQILLKTRLDEGRTQFVAELRKRTRVRILVAYR